MLLKRLYDLEILRRDMKKLSETGFKTNNSNTIKLFKISKIVFSINIEIVSIRTNSPFFWM